MRGISAFCLLLLFVFQAVAVENSAVQYSGGTISNLKESSLGKLDTSSPTELAFEHPGGRLVIPYAKIVSFECSQQVARHLGVLPGIAVGLVKKRQRRHFLRVTYRDDQDREQVAIFEVPKQMPRTLLPILQVRAPQGCYPRTPAACRVED
jgi:hypothetical protein